MILTLVSPMKAAGLNSTSLGDFGVLGLHERISV